MCRVYVTLPTWPDIDKHNLCISHTTFAYYILCVTYPWTCTGSRWITEGRATIETVTLDRTWPRITKNDDEGPIGDRFSLGITRFRVSSVRASAWLASRGIRNVCRIILFGGLSIR